MSGQREAAVAALATGSGLLPFHHELLTQLLAEDGLCVLAAGLGLHQVCTHPALGMRWTIEEGGLGGLGGMASQTD